MKTSYFTFGQSHVHLVDGFTYDKDVVVKITAEDPCGVMNTVFGSLWSTEYYDLDDLKPEYYPRGVKELLSVNEPEAAVTIKKRYIGDSVYVSFDGHKLTLTTENGLSTDPSNEIILESEVYSALVNFVASIRIR